MRTYKIILNDAELLRITNALKSDILDMQDMANDERFAEQNKDIVVLINECKNIIKKIKKTEPLEN